MKLAINGGNPAISEIIDDWKDIQKDDINLNLTVKPYKPCYT